jgi:hypothetical protein
VSTVVFLLMMFLLGVAVLFMGLVLFILFSNTILGWLRKKMQ